MSLVQRARLGVKNERIERMQPSVELSTRQGAGFKGSLEEFVQRCVALLLLLIQLLRAQADRHGSYQRTQTRIIVALRHLFSRIQVALIYKRNSPPVLPCQSWSSPSSSCWSSDTQGPRSCSRWPLLPRLRCLRGRPSAHPAPAWSSRSRAAPNIQNGRCTYLNSVSSVFKFTVIWQVFASENNFVSDAHFRAQHRVLAIGRVDSLEQIQ